MTDLEKQIAEAKNKVVELEKELKDSKARPQKGDVYYMWSHNGVCSGSWDEYSWEIHILERGEVFKTKEECELDNTKRRILKRIKALEKGFVPDLNDMQEFVYQIYYNKKERSFGVTSSCSYSYYSILGNYKTTEDVRAAIAELGDSLKILAGIK